MNKIRPKTDLEVTKTDYTKGETFGEIWEFGHAVVVSDRTAVVADKMEQDFEKVVKREENKVAIAVAEILSDDQLLALEIIGVLGERATDVVFYNEIKERVDDP